MHSFSFPKSERLLDRGDFVNLNRKGKRHHTAHFTIFFRKNGLAYSRLGITTSKRTGKAVTRNRIRRVVREFYRLHKAFFPSGCDILISAKKGAGELDFWKVREELLGFFTDKKSGAPF
ncbi:MAG: ribonuclease P protein component [Deltaproteobacteria bacterium]|nr:ribonuclease P protein component [Deltaproteobacteria bacterium]